MTPAPIAPAAAPPKPEPVLAVKTPIIVNPPNALPVATLQTQTPQPIKIIANESAVSSPAAAVVAKFQNPTLKGINLHDQLSLLFYYFGHGLFLVWVIILIV